MMDLISLYSSPGETICDPFMGSGTTGVASLKLGRRFIGVEQDKRHFETACRRLEQIAKQPDLFIAPAAKAVQVQLFADAAD